MIAPDEALPEMPCGAPASGAGRSAWRMARPSCGGGYGAGKVRLYDAQGRFMGLGEADDRGQVAAAPVCRR